MLDALGAGWALRRVIRFLLRRALGRILQPESLDAHQARSARDAQRAQPRDLVLDAWRGALVPLASPLRMYARRLLVPVLFARRAAAARSRAPAPCAAGRRHLLRAAVGQRAARARLAALARAALLRRCRRARRRLSPPRAAQRLHRRCHARTDATSATGARVPAARRGAARRADARRRIAQAEEGGAAVRAAAAATAHLLARLRVRVSGLELLLLEDTGREGAPEATADAQPQGTCGTPDAPAATLLRLRELEYRDDTPPAAAAAPDASAVPPAAAAAVKALSFEGAELFLGRGAPPQPGAAEGAAGWTRVLGGDAAANDGWGGSLRVTMPSAGGVGAAVEAQRCARSRCTARLRRCVTRAPSPPRCAPPQPRRPLQQLQQQQLLQRRSRLPQPQQQKKTDFRRRATRSHAALSWARCCTTAATARAPAPTKRFSTAPPR